MKTQAHGPSVTVGTSRQVVIPKKIHDELGLKPGDILEVQILNRRVVFTPKALVDKDVADALDEAINDLKHGRGLGPFDNAADAIRALRSKPKR